MKNQTSPESPLEDLDWLAFRYICAELTDAEEAGFLEMLAHDQSACEALARQSLLMEAARAGREVAAKQPPSLATKPDSRWKSLVAICLATAAMLAIVVPLIQGFRGAASEETASDLALRWTTGLRLAESSGSGAEMPAIDSVWPEEVAANEAGGAEENFAEPSLTVPNWMMLAVSVQGGATDEAHGYPVDSSAVEN